MSFVDWFMASLLYCFPYSQRSFALLKALAEVTVIFSLSSLRAITLEREQQKNNELIPKMMQRGLGVITLQGVIEKSPILLSQYLKNENWMAP